MKKIFKSKTMMLIIALSLLGALMIAGATMAVLQSNTGKIVNTFKTEPVKTKIYEEYDSTSLAKKPYVVNTSGATDCLVRVKITVTPSDVEGRLISLDYDGANNKVKSWIKGDDGFYYYNGYLKPNEKTAEPVFSKVNWIPKVTDADGEEVDDYSDFEEFEIIVYQESVQVRAVSETGDDAYNAVNEDGSYNAKQASEIWKIYDNGTGPAENQ